MLGSDYLDYDDFKDACLDKTEGPLDVQRNIGKIYSIKQIRKIAREAGIDWTDLDAYGVEEERKGIARRYDIAEAIGNNCDVNKVGKILSKIDHNFTHNFLSFRRFKNHDIYQGIKKFVKFLKRNKGYEFKDNYCLFRNGLSSPSTRNCAIESIHIDEKREEVSFLYSCLRILVEPEGRQSDYNDFFVSRIPVLIRVLFKHRLLEYSIPFFSEPNNDLPGFSSSIPLRFQKVIQSAELNYMQIVPFDVDMLDLQSFTLYLEEKLDAIDMGWKIAPQTLAEFNLTQGVIPLKNILDNFSESLEEELRSRGVENPLEDINLYHIFRALKEQSHTYLFVLQTPIGQRGGKFTVSVLYGEENSGYPPIVTLNSNDEDISDRIHHALDESQLQEIVNPFTFEELFTEEN